MLPKNPFPERGADIKAVLQILRSDEDIRVQWVCHQVITPS